MFQCPGSANPCPFIYVFIRRYFTTGLNTDNTETHSTRYCYLNDCIEIGTTDIYSAYFVTSFLSFAISTTAKGFKIPQGKAHPPLMKTMKSLIFSLLAFASTSAAHYTFPELVVNGKGTGNWQYVRQTANYQSNGTFIYYISPPSLLTQI